MKNYLLAGGLSTILLLSACSSEEESQAEENNEQTEEQMSEEETEDTSTDDSLEEQTSDEQENTIDVSDYMTRYEYEPIEYDREIEDIATEESEKAVNGEFDSDRYMTDIEYGSELTNTFETIESSEEFQTMDEEIENLDEEAKEVTQEMVDTFNSLSNITSEMHQNLDTDNFDKEIPEHFKPVHQNFEKGFEISSDTLSGTKDFLEDNVGEEVEEETIDEIEKIMENNLEVADQYFEEATSLQERASAAYDYEAVGESWDENWEGENESEEIEHSTSEESSQDNRGFDNIANQGELESIIYGNYSEVEKIQAYNNAVENGIIPQGTVTEGSAVSAYESSVGLQNGETEKEQLAERYQMWVDEGLMTEEEMEIELNK